MRTIHKIELGIVVAAIFLLTLSVAPQLKGFSTITGFVSTETHRQPVQLNFDQSRVIELETDSEMLISHFSLTGYVAGEKAVNIYLDNGRGDRALVYTNIRGGSGRKGLPAITGLASHDAQSSSEGGIRVNEGPLLNEFTALQEGEGAYEGGFKDECIETCVLPAEIFKSDKFELVVLLEPGAELTITGMTFISVVP